MDYTQNDTSTIMLHCGNGVQLHLPHSLLNRYTITAPFYLGHQWERVTTGLPPTKYHLGGAHSQDIPVYQVPQDCWDI